MTGVNRVLGSLAFEDVEKSMSASSILCLPLGAMEQHGPHLPLNTDLVIAEEFTLRIVARYGEDFDLWRLPAIPFGVSPEHAWAPGTMSLSVDSFLGLLRNLGDEIVRSLPARNLLVINGHGGNRGLLDAILYEWQAGSSLNSCVVHPLVLSGAESTCAFPDIHAGKVETSLMLEFAAGLVRLDRIAGMPRPDAAAVKEMILEKGASWPWDSSDPRIATRGVTGAANEASAEFGREVIAKMLVNMRPVLERLRDNMRGP